MALPLMGIGGAILCALVLQGLAGRGAVLTLVLAGVAISSLCAALMSLALNLSPNPYAAAEIMFWLMGSVTEGMVGTGFLYTNKDSLTIGVGCMLSDFKANPQRTAPYTLLEKLKRHPSIAPLIEGGEMKEYAAHLIPEGGFNAVPKIYGDGWMIVGDSGGFVNAVHREGSNLAMTTGRLALNMPRPDYAAVSKIIDAARGREAARKFTAEVAQETRDSFKELGLLK
mgnify:CR=1 FL=1